MGVTVVNRRNPLETILPLVNTIGGLMSTFMQYKQNQAQNTALLEQKKKEDADKQAQEDKKNAVSSFTKGYDVIKEIGGSLGPLADVAKQAGIPLPKTEETSGYPLSQVTGIGGEQKLQRQGTAPLTTMDYPTLPTPQEKATQNIEKVRQEETTKLQLQQQYPKAEIQRVQDTESPTGWSYADVNSKKILMPNAPAPPESKDQFDMVTLYGKKGDTKIVSVPKGKDFTVPTGYTTLKPDRILPSDFDKKWTKSTAIATEKLKRTPTSEEIAATYKSTFGSEGILQMLFRGGVGGGKGITYDSEGRIITQ